MTRIDAIFDAERTINGAAPECRLATRREEVAPLVIELEAWMRIERVRHAPVAKAMDYMLKRWGAFARFLEDGRIYLTTDAAERALRGVALGRKAWSFAGSDRGGERARRSCIPDWHGEAYDVDPQTWLADVLDRIRQTPISRLE